MAKRNSELPTTALCQYTADSIHYRGEDLVGEILGHASFVEVFIRQVSGSKPTKDQLAIFEAVLIILMEHGMTPSAIASRMVYFSSPENLQSGVAAGLLAVGSQFVGTMENCAEILDVVVRSKDRDASCERIVKEFKERRKAVPGFGHHLHVNGDPRAKKLLEMAAGLTVAGESCEALLIIHSKINEVSSKQIPINATGAVAAVLSDCGFPTKLMRGFAVLSRTAGLISHIAEEQKTPSGMKIWSILDKAMTQELSEKR